MKAVIQRSKNSSVSVAGEIKGSIKSGLVVLLGIMREDTIADVDYLVRKILNLRIFDDEKGIMNKSIIDVGGEILSISQFTLQAETSHGNRPSYIKAMKGEEAKVLYDDFNQKLSQIVPTYTGIFGADMQVNIQNDGPITIIIDSKER